MVLLIELVTPMKHLIFDIFDIFPKFQSGVETRISRLHFVSEAQILQKSFSWPKFSFKYKKQEKSKILHGENP